MSVNILEKKNSHKWFYHKFYYKYLSVKIVVLENRIKKLESKIPSWKDILVFLHS